MTSASPRPVTAAGGKPGGSGRVVVVDRLVVVVVVGGGGGGDGNGGARCSRSAHTSLTASPNGIPNERSVAASSAPTSEPSIRSASTRVVVAARAHDGG